MQEGGGGPPPPVAPLMSKTPRKYKANELRMKGDKNQGKKITNQPTNRHFFQQGHDMTLGIDKATQ